MIQKILITIFLIAVVFFIFRVFKKKQSIDSDQNQNDDKIVDLEKDPTSNEYKPKE
tara:strand:+ start:251 stop:418 length:168 start_codon:yes stop_codon:yes gene_type:complete